MNDIFATIYELGSVFYLGDFSGVMYDNSLYVSVGLVAFFSSLIWMVIYYYLINHPRYDKWYHWLGYVVAAGLGNAGFAYWTIGSKIELLFAKVDEPVPFSTEFFSFAIVNFIWTLVLCFAFSMPLKWGSTNLRKTPF
jgi:hypothetical protein